MKTLSAEEFLARANAIRSIAAFTDEEEPAHAQVQVSDRQRAAKRKDYENGPQEGNRRNFFNSELARYAEGVPEISEEILLVYANLIRDTMLHPRPTEMEWHREYRPGVYCKKLVSKELKRRSDGNGPKAKKKSREACIIEANAVIQEDFILARDAIDHIYFYVADSG